MKKITARIRNTFFTKEFITFVFCGGVGTLTNMLISTICSLAMDATVAYVFGYFGSSLVTYTLNSKLTFRAPLSIKRYIRFVVSYLPNFAILFCFVAIFINVLKWNQIFVYGFAAVLALPITFLLVRIVAFAKEKNGNNANRQSSIVR